MAIPGLETPAGKVPKGIFGEAGLAFVVLLIASSEAGFPSDVPESGEPANGELRVGRVF